MANFLVPLSAPVGAMGEAVFPQKTPLFHIYSSQAISVMECSCKDYNKLAHRRAYFRCCIKGYYGVLIYFYARRN